MAKTEKKPRKLTPIGEARWAHVMTPKAPYEGKGEAKYSIDVVFDPEESPEWKSWANDLIAKVKALPEQVNKKTGEKLAKQSPLKRELDQSEQPTGRWYVTFKTGEKFKPPVFDKYGKPMEGVKIGNGSKVMVSYSENEYDAFGGGINLYLNGVQVKELHEFGGQTADAFGFECDAPPADDDLAPF